MKPLVFYIAVGIAGALILLILVGIIYWIYVKRKQKTKISTVDTRSPTSRDSSDTNVSGKQPGFETKTVVEKSTTKTKTVETVQLEPKGMKHIHKQKTESQAPKFVTNYSREVNQDEGFTADTQQPKREEQKKVDSSRKVEEQADKAIGQTEATIKRERRRKKHNLMTDQKGNPDVLAHARSSEEMMKDMRVLLSDAPKKRASAEMLAHLKENVSLEDHIRETLAKTFE